MVISVCRKERLSERILRGCMIAFTVLFLLLGILFSTAFMLPCFLMACAYFIYSAASKKEWEYTLDDDRLRIERVSDRGRKLLHDISLKEIEALSSPDDPSVVKYRKGGSERIAKFDYSSYNENVPYYTLIAKEDGQRIKLLLDLTPEAIQWIRRQNRSAVHIPN